MKVKQISVFLENKAGRLSELARVLKEHDLNIRALALADTTDFGILRLILDRPDVAFGILKKQGFSVAETEVLAVEVSDQPGGLSLVLDELSRVGINVEYMYAFVEKKEDNAVVVLRVEDLEKTVSVLQSQGVAILSAEEVYGL